MRRKTFHMVTLGCPKNRVDAEVMWAQAAQMGFDAVDDPAMAEVIIVNTCAFIRSAVQESIDTILDLARNKQQGMCSMLVVAGCLPARYRGQLVSDLPEVDLFLGPGEVDQLPKYLKQRAVSAHNRFQHKTPQAFLPNASTPRANSLSPGAAYLKVAEGCSRRCSFCTIPSIRGPQRSRPLDDLVRDAESLTRLGVKEVILVAQDLAGWGKDLSPKPAFRDLVQALSSVAGLYWLRLMYLFPNELSTSLQQVIAGSKTILPYLDLPLQHVNARVLHNMRRQGDPKTLAQKIAQLRAGISGLVLRTSLMTGFPGEDAAAFGQLLRFVERNRFERLGVFAFSPEENTPAAKLKDRPSFKTAEARREQLMSLQRDIALDYHRSLVGTTMEVLVEEGQGNQQWVGRAWNQAPEVDGVTYLQGKASPGDMVLARIDRAGPYDLEGSILS